MITITVPFDNPLNQKTYENIINTLQFHQLQCTCGHSGCLTIHGYYTRSLKKDDSGISLSICRVRCSHFRAASARGALHPNGSFIHPAPTSIKRWYQHYLKNGFDGLLPSSRSDEGTSRKIHPDLEEQITYLKTNYPRMSAAAIFRQLCDNGSVNRNELSESTVNRFINSLARVVVKLFCNICG